MKKLSIFLLALVAGAGTMFASDTSVDGIWYNFNNGNLTAEVACQGTDPYSYPDRYSGEVVIPSSVTYNAQTYTVTSIGWSAFTACKGLTSVTIPNSVTSIVDWAFCSCTSLTSVTIPNSVTSIGGSAFSWSGLTSVTIGNSVTSIGESAFDHCLSLTSVTIGNSVTSIGRWAFSHCSNLTSVTIPNSVTDIGDGAFEYCSSLTSVTIPNSVTRIGKEAFRGCTGLTSVTIPNSVISIGDYAFEGCTGLTSVTIPNSVFIIIGSSAFTGCSITTLTVLATTPPSGGSACGINAANCTLYVPTESVNTYANAVWWEDFKEIKPLGDLICVQFVDWDGSLIARCYIEEGASAIAPANPTRDGYTFIGWDKEFSNVTEDLVVTALYEEAGHNMTYTLLFQNGIDEAEISHESITFMLPVAPSITGFTFLKWVVVGGDLVDTITIQAVYQADEPSSAPAVYTNPANPAQKLIRNGNVYILTEDKTYTITGQQVK